MAARIVSVLPILLSAVVVALTIVLLVSGASTSNGDKNYWMSLNTSKIGQEAIQLTPTTTTSSSPSTTSSTDPLTSILGGLDGIFGGIINNITGQIDSGIEDLSAQLVANLTKAIGVKDFYNLFTTHMCEGNYVDSSNPNSKMQVTSCYTYDNAFVGLRNISRSIPSSFVIATTNVSVPLISALGKTTDSIVGLASAGSKAMMAFLIIGCVTLGLTMFGSAGTLVLGYRRVLTILNMALSLLGSNVLLILAIMVTALVAGGSSTINDFGSAFQLDTKEGKAFLAMTWVAAVLATGVSSFWFLVWFVEGRRTSFRRQWRTEEQIGNYRGILRETMDNLRRPPGPGMKAVPYTKEGVVRGSPSLEMAGPEPGGRT